MHEDGYLSLYFTRRGGKKPINVYAEQGKQSVKRGFGRLSFQSMSANEGDAERICQGLPQLRLSD